VNSEHGGRWLTRNPPSAASGFCNAPRSVSWRSLATRSRRARDAQQRGGVLASLENGGSGHKRGLVAIDPLHETTPARRKIVHELRLVEPQTIELDQVSRRRAAAANRPRSRRPKKSAVSLVWRLTQKLKPAIEGPRQRSRPNAPA